MRCSSNAIQLTHSSGHSRLESLTSPAKYLHVIHIQSNRVANFKRCQLNLYSDCSSTKTFDSRNLLPCQYRIILDVRRAFYVHLLRSTIAGAQRPRQFKGKYHKRFASPHQRCSYKMHTKQAGTTSETAYCNIIIAAPNDMFMSARIVSITMSQPAIYESYAQTPAFLPQSTQPKSCSSLITGRLSSLCRRKNPAK